MDNNPITPHAEETQHETQFTQPSKLEETQPRRISIKTIMAALAVLVMFGLVLSQMLS